MLHKQGASGLYSIDHEYYAKKRSLLYMIPSSSKTSTIMNTVEYSKKIKIKIKTRHSTSLVIRKTNVKNKDKKTKKSDVSIPLSAIWPELSRPRVERVLRVHPELCVSESQRVIRMHPKLSEFSVSTPSCVSPSPPYV